MDKNKIKEQIEEFKKLSPEERGYIGRKLEEQWVGYIIAFEDQCLRDKRLTELESKMTEFEKTLAEVEGFDLEKEFTSIRYDSDGECSFPVEFFDHERLKKMGELSKTWETQKAQMQGDIDRLKASKIALFKNARLKNLTQKLEKTQKNVDHYNDCMRKQSLKSECQAKQSSYYAPMKKESEQIINGYAKIAVELALEDNPSLACVRHLTDFTNGHKCRYDIEFINKNIRNVRNEIQLETNKGLEGQFGL